MTNYQRILAAAVLPLLTACPTPTPPAPLPPSPQVASFTATPGDLKAAGKVTLAWETRSATQVEITDGTGATVPGVDNQLSGQVEVDVASSSLFVLSARNDRGVRDSAIASVTVAGGPVGLLFTAVPATVGAGETTTLAWSAPGASTLAISTTAGGNLDLKGQVASGSVIVTPDGDTTYTLTAGGKTATATVLVRPAVTVFSAAPPFAKPGDPVVLTWQTRGATRVTIETPGRGTLVTETDAAKVASGTFNDTIPATADPASIVPYVLRAEGSVPASSTSQTLNVTLGGVPAITSFTAPEYAKAFSTFELSWETTGADRVEISAGGTTLYVSPDAASAAQGSQLVPTPAAATEYTLTAIAGRGGSATAKKTVVPVGPTSVTTFTASPPTVAAGGDPVTLTWNAPGTRKLKISVRNEFTLHTQSGPAAEAGTLTVYPNGPTEYFLEADNTVGNVVTASQSVTVTAPAVVTPTASGPMFAGSPTSLGFAVGGGTASVYGLNHNVIDSQAASTGFVDISTTGTKLPFTATANESVKTFDPDFETWLYGQRWAGTVAVSVNGFLVLGPAASTRSVNDPLPDATLEDNFIAPYWEDLVLIASSGIYWQVMGQAPERKLVVQWNGVRVDGETTSELTFQAQLQQTGVITFEYKTLTTTTAAPVIGVQGPAGIGLAHLSGVSPDTSVTFFGPKTAPATVKMDREGPWVGFVKIGAGYLKLPYTAASIVRPGDISITEVLYAPAASIAATGEWIELRNSSSAAIDLAGWTLDFGGGSTHTLAVANGTTVIPATGVLVLGQSSVAAENDGVTEGYVYGPAFTLGDTTGTLTLGTTGYSTSATWNAATAGQGGVGVSFTLDPGPFLKSTDTTTTLPHALLCSGVASFGALGQLGSPGLDTGCFGYSLRRRPVSYFDISGSGTPLFVAGDMDMEIVTVSLAAAPFPHFGVNHSAVQVSTNGFVAFKTTLTTYYDSNLSKPSTSEPRGIAAIFWDDLDATTLAGATANAYSQRMAAGEDPANPGAHWIIQWHHFSNDAAGDDDLNFQVKLFDTGVIEYHYATMTSGSTSNYGRGNSASSWLDLPAGGTGLIIGINDPFILPDSAYVFTPQ